MHRPHSSPAVGRKGHLLPRINSNPSKGQPCYVVCWHLSGCSRVAFVLAGLSVTSQVAYEQFWQADIDVGVGSTQGYRQYHEDEFQVVAFMSPNHLPTAAAMQIGRAHV